MYQCPKCQGSLTVVMTEENRLDKCTQCGGLWFDKGELLALLDKGIKFRADGEMTDQYQGLNTSSGTCPICRGIALVQVTLGEITIEECPNCKGVWLEQGEYSKILEDGSAEDLKQLLSREG